MKRIRYLSWPAKEITGGIKVVFRHVEALRSLGFDTVVATEDGAAPGWFATQAPIVTLASLTPGDDVFVFPENDERLLRRFADWPNRKVVLCQNQYMVFRGVGQRGGYGDFGVQTILCPTQQVATYCWRRFPSLAIFWAQEDDLLGCTTQLAEAVRLAAEAKQRYHEMFADAQAAAAFYSEERFRSRLLECWRQLAE